MIRRSCIFLVVLFVFFPFGVFPQNQQAPSAGALRDYVGLINQSYHPDIVAYFKNMQDELAKKGETNAVKAIDIFLGGGFGSGFIFNDAKEDLYVITNYHVIAQAYSLSITFERQDGFKKKFENLKIIAADEENDLALLAFAPGDKPMDQGLRFITRPVQEGEDVYSAGFPGLGITAIWQLGRGMISNANVRFPKSLTDETLMGPYIQHTAQIDSGNSGGPLLIPQPNVPSGYAVAGINTMSGLRRQAANYAIPISTVQTFIDAALNPKPETYRQDLDKRLAVFIEGLGVNRAVYPHIAEFLSSSCVGENAEFAMSEMYDKGTSSVRRAFLDKCEESVVGAMGYAVAWTIEDSIRNSGAIKAVVKEVFENGEDYIVVFTISGKDHSSRWVREYGNWRIRSFGTVAAGDKTLIAQKETQRKMAQKLKVNSFIHIDGGFASLFDKAPMAGYFSLDFKYMGLNVYIAGSDFLGISGFAGYRWDIPVQNVAVMPYLRTGFQFMKDEEYEDGGYRMGFPIAFMIQTGFKVTCSYVPGLLLGTGFQFNILNLMDSEYKKPMKMGFNITIGYAF